jgi:hypothetical protein
MKSNNSLKFESLKNDYTLAIIEYDNAYKNFIILANQPGISIKKINNSKILGKPYLSSLSVDDVSICIQDCDSNINCSGLDYNQQNNKCTFYTGNLAIKNNNNYDSYIKDIKSVFFDENKKVVIISSFPGTGKTTLANEIAYRFIVDVLRYVSIFKTLKTIYIYSYENSYIRRHTWSPTLEANRSKRISRSSYIHW